MKKYFSILFLFSATTSNAGQVSNANVIDIETKNDGVIRFAVDGNYVDKPDCNGRAGNYFAFDGNTDYGKLMFSQILAAQKAQTPIYVKGAGTCNLAGNPEDVIWIQSKQ